MSLPGHVFNLDNRHKLVELFFNLFDDPLISTGNKRHSTQGVIHGWCNTEAFNIVSTGGKQAGNACQDAEFIFNKDCDGMPHSRIISSSAAPAGTIG